MTRIVGVLPDEIHPIRCEKKVRAPAKDLAKAGSRVADICISFRGNLTQMAKASSISSSVWPFVSGRRQRMNRKPAKQIPA